MKSSKNDHNFLLESLINELANEISDKVISTIEMHLENNLAKNLNGQKLLLTTEELADELSVSKSTIRKLRDEGLPEIKFGKNVRFDKKQVYNYLSNLKF